MIEFEITIMTHHYCRSKGETNRNSEHAQWAIVPCQAVITACYWYVVGDRRQVTVSRQSFVSTTNRQTDNNCNHFLFTTSTHLSSSVDIDLQLTVGKCIGLTLLTGSVAIRCAYIILLPVKIRTNHVSDVAWFWLATSCIWNSPSHESIRLDPTRPDLTRPDSTRDQVNEMSEKVMVL